MCASAHAWKRSCKLTIAVEDAQLSADGEWLFVLYVEDRGPRWLDVFDLAGGTRVGHFHPWVGQEMWWVDDKIAVSYGCGAPCAGFNVFTREGVAVFNEVAAEVVFAPDRRSVVVSNPDRLTWTRRDGLPKLGVSLIELSTLKRYPLSAEVPVEAESGETIPEVTWTRAEIQIAFKYGLTGDTGEEGHPLPREALFRFPRP